MANVDRPNGFRAVGTISGQSFEGAIRKVYVPSSDGTALAVGDWVKSAGSADAAGTTPSVTKATVGDYVLGLIVAIEHAPANAYTASTVNSLYRAASTEAYLYINADPELLAEAQEDSVGGNLAATNVGQNIDLIDAGVDTATGNSGMELDSSTAGTGNTKVFRLHELVDRPNNALGTNARWLVSVNLHELRTQTTGV